MKRAGISWSVSTLASGKEQARAVRRTNGRIRDVPPASGRASVRCPVTAAAAAIAGDIRWVRLPGPCRPLKLRLVVEAQRSPGATMSPFMPTHIEQPASTHSSPAARKIGVEPFLLGLPLHRHRARRDKAGNGALRPLSTAAAARKSSMRLLAQEPMNTRSTRMSVNVSPGFKSI